MAEHHLRPEDFVAPGPEVRPLPTGDVHTVVVHRHRAQWIEFDDALFRTDSAVLLPESQHPSDQVIDDQGRVRTGVGVVAACLRHAQERPERTLLVAGHTDTTGDAGYNVTLSRQRAACVHAALVGDRETFSSLAHQRPAPGDKHQILRWVERRFGWLCDPAHYGQDLWRATLEFQRTYNANGQAGNAAAAPVAESGWFGPDTWKAVFDCYEHQLAKDLGVPLGGLPGFRAGLRFVYPGQPWVGCGEYQPIDQVGRDGYRSQCNRRVEALWFDPGEEPTLPCHGGPCRPGDCHLYSPIWYRRTPLPVMPSTLPWRAYWEDVEVPAGHGTSRRMVLEAPGLASGREVLFEVEQQDGARTVKLEPLRVTSDKDAAVASFEQWYASERVGPPVELGAGERFAQVRFAFVAHVSGRSTPSARPLPYSDRLDVRFHYREAPDEPVALAPFTVHSPWGRVTGRTGEDGRVQVDGLPPGGARAVVSHDHPQEPAQ